MVDIPKRVKRASGVTICEWRVFVLCVRVGYVCSIVFFSLVRSFFWFVSVARIASFRTGTVPKKRTGSHGDTQDNKEEEEQVVVVWRKRKVGINECFFCLSARVCVCLIVDGGRPTNDVGQRQRQRDSGSSNSSARGSR